MSTPVRHPRYSLVLRSAIVLAVGGGICVVTSVAVAFLIADHSSSDSSPSSLIAIGLVSIGFLAMLLAAALLTGEALARLWRSRRARRPPA
jgi:hypothetical protein